MCNANSTVWSAICHVRVEREGGIVRLICSREADAFRGRCAIADNIEIETVKVNLNLTLECSLFKLLHVSVQGNELSSQHIVAWFDVAGQLDFEAVAIVGSKFISPSIYGARQCTANHWSKFPLIIPTEGINPDS